MECVQPYRIVKNNKKTKQTFTTRKFQKIKKSQNKQTNSPLATSQKKKQTQTSNIHYRPAKHTKQKSNTHHSQRHKTATKTKLQTKHNKII